VSIEISSSAFSEGRPIPVKYTGEGQDLSPPLTWSGVPDGARQLALICDDPDAPMAEPWVHWVIYRLAADATALPEGVAKTAEPDEPAGAVQGANSWPQGENIGYGGPMPPPGHGTHHYFFKLYALDVELTAGPGLDKPGLLAAMKGHVIGEGQLMGTYER
jgi:Raf kinase inhibitor-like YbhB/YbcL family protein